jgi:Fe2+ or Zn2+ uptake regulation protein
MIPVMTMDVHAIVESRLRAVHQRYTPKRRALVDTLKRAGKPLAMTDMTSGRTAPPQSSAYRNLGVLEQAGVVRRVITEDEFARYELAEELTEHHHHLICSTCGKVQDVTVPAELEGTLDRTLDRLARKAGFANVDHRLDLIGTCKDCARTSS